MRSTLPVRHRHHYCRCMSPRLVRLEQEQRRWDGGGHSDLFCPFGSGWSCASSVVVSSSYLVSLFFCRIRLNLDRTLRVPSLPSFQQFVMFLMALRVTFACLLASDELLSLNPQHTAPTTHCPVSAHMRACRRKAYLSASTYPTYHHPTMAIRIHSSSRVVATRTISPSSPP